MDINYRPKITHSEKPYIGKRISLRRDTVDCEGTLVVREVVEHPGAVAILPVHEDGTVSLIRQYRHPIDAVLLEVPAGTLEEGESPEACARRELSEEAWLAAEEWIHLGAIFTTPGFSSEKIYLFSARKLSAKKLERDAGEYMDVERLPSEALFQGVLDGTIRDAKTIAAIQLARLHKII